MALPFYLPSEEELEDNYRRLERLLRELYYVLRALLNAGSVFLPDNGIFRGNNHRPPRPPPPASASGSSSSGPSPRSSITPTQRSPMGPPRGRIPVLVSNRAPSSVPIFRADANKSAAPSSSSSDYWLNIGRELRDIADRFSASCNIASPVIVHQPRPVSQVHSSGAMQKHPSTDHVSVQLEMDDSAISIVGTGVLWHA